MNEGEHQLLQHVHECISRLEGVIEQMKTPSRAQIAAMAMQGLCGQNVISKHWTPETLSESIAKSSVMVADALLKELEATK